MQEVVSRQVRRRAAKANLYWYKVYQKTKDGMRLGEPTVLRCPPKGVSVVEYKAAWARRQPGQ